MHGNRNFQTNVREFPHAEFVKSVERVWDAWANASVVVCELDFTVY
jgi:hypothetical protein